MTEQTYDPPMVFADEAAMTPVDEAVERVKAYVASWDGFDDGTIISDELGPNPLTLGDLRALLSALELGRLDAEARLHVEASTLQGALFALEEVREAVFGRVGGEPDVYADYDECCAMAFKMTQAIEGIQHGLDASQAHVKHKAEGDCEPPPAPPTGEGGGL